MVYVYGLRLSVPINQYSTTPICIFTHAPPHTSYYPSAAFFACCSQGSTVSLMACSYCYYRVSMVLVPAYDHFIVTWF